VKKVETEKDTGLIDQDSDEFKNFVKYGLITWVILCILGLSWEHLFIRLRKQKIKPYSKRREKCFQGNLYLEYLL